MKKSIQIGIIAIVGIFLLALTMFIIGLSSSKPSKQKKPEFHVKIECSSIGYFTIAFTNDNFDTEYKIQQAFDMSRAMEKEYVIHQERIFRSQLSAIVFAKKFTSYQVCEQYNDSIKRQYDSLLAYRKMHPVDGSYISENTDQKDCETIIVR